METTRRMRGTCGRSCVCSSAYSKCTSGWSLWTASLSERSESLWLVPCSSIAKHLLEARQFMPSLFEAAHSRSARGAFLALSQVSSWLCVNVSVWERLRRAAICSDVWLLVLCPPLHSTARARPSLQSGLSRLFGYVMWAYPALMVSEDCAPLVEVEDNHLFMGPSHSNPQAAAPWPGAACPGVGALPESAVDLQPPAGAGAVFRCGGDYWVRVPQAVGVSDQRGCAALRPCFDPDSPSPNEWGHRQTLGLMH